MNEEKGEIKYCIYDFMLGLGLNDSEIKIYAFLYAYRKSKIGFFFGKRSFLKDKCGVSMRTVERAIPNLKKKGLIEEVENGKFRGLACKEDFIPKKSGKVKSVVSAEEVSTRPIKPRYEIMEMGRGYFTLTREQYDALLELVPIRELESYVGRMNRMLEKNIESGAKPPKNYYKTIRKWILEDCSL